MTINSASVKAVFIDFPSPGSDYHLDIPLNPYGEKSIHSKWVGLHSEHTHLVYLFREIANGASYGMNSFNAHSEYVHVDTHPPTNQELNWMVLTGNHYILYSANTHPLYPGTFTDNRNSAFLDEREVDRLEGLRTEEDMRQEWFNYLQRADLQR